MSTPTKTALSFTMEVGFRILEHLLQRDPLDRRAGVGEANEQRPSFAARCRDESSTDFQAFVRLPDELGAMSQAIRLEPHRPTPGHASYLGQQNSTTHAVVVRFCMDMAERRRGEPKPLQRLHPRAHFRTAV